MESVEECWAPKIDMVFETDEKAYEFYCVYAKEMGFGVRKHLVKRRASGAVYSRVFSCYKEGFCRTSGEAKKPRPDSRTGCQAHLTIRIMDDGGFRVSEFEPGHNHELASPAAAMDSIYDLGKERPRGHAITRPHVAVRRGVAPAKRLAQKRLADNSSVELAGICLGGNVAKGSWIPKVDMEFLGDEAAYQFYSDYAIQIGFSVRKHLVKRRASGVIYSRTYACHKEGYHRRKDQQQARAPKPYDRTSCRASLTIKITKNGRYRVTEFIEKHNHPLVIPTKAHLFKWRWQRLSARSQDRNMNLADDVEFTMKGSEEAIMDGQAERYPRLTSLSAGCKNCISAKRKNVMQVGDTGAVMQYMQEKQVEDPSFYYALQVDEDDQLTNVFWTDAKSMTDFHYFGDVVCFDTMYKSSNYGRPFAQFIGVNHHKQAIIFGAALLYDETEISFKWLFETFDAVMRRKQPKVILTDRSEALSNVMGVLWPCTTHRICVCHVFNNAAKYLNFVFQASTTFIKDFSWWVYDIEDEDEFESGWKSILEKYDLSGNKWLMKLYEDREQWALPYGRETFCADMKGTLCGENMYNTLKLYLYQELDLLDFFKHYERIIQERRHAELQVDIHAQPNIPKAPISRMLRQAANSYTHEAFEVFQRELELSLDYMVYSCGQIESIFEYKVTNEENPKEYIVRFDPSNNVVLCSCKKFEFIGILCRHVLKTLDIINIKELPPQYILKRWTKDAKSGSASGHSESAQGESKPSAVNRYSSLCCTFNKIAARAAETVESYMFIESLSEQLMDQVYQILQTRPPEKPQIT